MKMINANTVISVTIRLKRPLKQLFMVQCVRTVAAFHLYAQFAFRTNNIFLGEKEPVINLFFDGDGTLLVLIDMEVVAAGLYQVKFTYETARADVPADQVRMSPPVLYSKQLFKKKQIN